MQRKVTKIATGQPAVDGAGVHLVRVLGKPTVEDFDPFLMLDSFDSRNPDDYLPGFPLHPHRGIETITYLIEGEIDHMDSLGNKGIIGPGQAQWMTAGSGILHQEMPQTSERMLGVQLWLNLPRAQKMTEPQYFDVRGDMIGLAREDKAEIRVLSGKYKDLAQGVSPHYLPATIFDISLEPGGTLRVPTQASENAFVFLIEGDAAIAGENVRSKSAVLLSDGDEVTLRAPENAPARLLFFSAQRLGEPVAWGGPIVMNTREELQEAFRELDEGSFIRHKPTGV